MITPTAGHYFYSNNARSVGFDGVCMVWSQC